MAEALYCVRVYVGPVHVAHYAQMARAAGYDDVWGGTEHVYAIVPGPAVMTETDRLALRQWVADTVYGRKMAAGWRDVEILGEVS